MFFKKKKYKEEIKKLHNQLNKEEKIITQDLEKAEKNYQQRNQIFTKDIPDLIVENTSTANNQIFQKVQQGLSKTKQAFTNGWLQAFTNVKTFNVEIIENIEEYLLTMDLGVVTALKIVEKLEKKLTEHTIKTQEEALIFIKNLFYQIMEHDQAELPVHHDNPSVYLFVGVNGVGKTTTIAKLAAQYHQAGKKVLVAAGDTFRAAAIDQLVNWCEKIGVDYVAHQINSDSSATMYDAAMKAQKEKYDILLCDTAGRLHTKKNLMEELKKNKLVLQKIIPEAPHSSILVLDATTGQNAILQTSEFHKQIGLTGLIMTKLDGTAKGGVTIGIKNEFNLPIYYIGIGEKVDDLIPFAPREYVDSLFEN